MVLPIGKKTARDIDRYIRVRAAHPHAEDSWLWLGKKGRLTASGIYQMIKDRGNAVGLPDLHPHQPGGRARALRGALRTRWQRGCDQCSDLS